jgi:hypothetical protein
MLNLTSILAFLASVFFSAANLRNPDRGNPDGYDSLRLTIGFGVANALFSILAYFLIEPLPVEYSLDKDEEFQGIMANIPPLPAEPDNEDEDEDTPEPGPEFEAQPEAEAQPALEAGSDDMKYKEKKRELPRWLLGRRSLLLISLAGGTLMLFILTFLLDIHEDNPAKLPFVLIFVILFTLFYSPGAGCVPFIYSSEVWPNEGRGTSCPILL